MQREFDDLMRSASTMKMSLTPDRLKTMEVRVLAQRCLRKHLKLLLIQAFKQEKDQKSFGRRPDPPFPPKSSGPPLVQDLPLATSNKTVRIQGIAHGKAVYRLPRLSKALCQRAFVPFQPLGVLGVN
jgi:hypothetical protein